jgi:predicted metalloprotease
LLGIPAKVDAQRGWLNKKEFNGLSVRLELQADLLAGFWAYHAQDDILDPGDLEAALRAANAIGDDRLQKQARGYVVPDSFTHGTSAQRIRWFRRGFQTGDLCQMDTFQVSDDDL